MVKQIVEDVDPEIRRMIEQRYEEYKTCLINEELFEYKDVFSLISLSLVEKIDYSILGTSFVKYNHRDMDEEFINVQFHTAEDTIPPCIKEPFNSGWRWVQIKQVVKSICFSLLHYRWIYEQKDDYDVLLHIITELHEDERVYYIAAVLDDIWNMEFFENSRKEGGVRSSVNDVVLVDKINERNILDKQLKIINREEKCDKFYYLVETGRGYFYDDL